MQLGEVVTLRNGGSLGNERCTDEYDYPPEKRGLLIFRIVQSPTFERFGCFDHKKAGLILSTERVVVETL
jgi:hypothetical protein